MVQKIMLGKSNKKTQGITLIESLVATIIIGIGFIAVFQMVKYSVRSIDVSLERSKNGFLVNMVVEDVLANKYSKKNNKYFYEELKDNSTKGWIMDTCTSEIISGIKTNILDSKYKKWNNLLNKNRVKCHSENDKKELKILEVCNSVLSADKKVSCDYTNDTVYKYDNNGTLNTKKIFDKRFFGRMEMFVSNTKKKKIIYFEIQ
jgi:Tfp pilus assembly protein PilV